MRIFFITCVSAALPVFAGPASAGDLDEALKAPAKGKLAEIAADPALIAAIRAQNVEHAAIGDSDIATVDNA